MTPELGLGSTALRFGAATQFWVAGLYAGLGCSGCSPASAAGGGIVSSRHCAARRSAVRAGRWRRSISADGDNCLQRFRSNRWVGWLFFTGLVLELVVVNAARAP